MHGSTCDISVIIPTWRRPMMLATALRHVMACCPAPREILVHVDAGDVDTERDLRHEYGRRVRWITSHTRQGPGGARNRLVREASAPLVASFDDDSWPLDPDYFSVAERTLARYPQAGVLVGQEVRPGTTPAARVGTVNRAACYQSGACVLRREAFFATRGYLPLHYAYGMEEADVALQLIDAGWQLLQVSDLRVYHDTRLEHHAGPEINAAYIANAALLAYLRYPVSYWPLGVAQVLNRVRYAVRTGRWNGICSGLCQAPVAVWRYRAQRQPVRKASISLSRRLAKADVR